MTYQIDRFVDEQNHYRCHGPEQYYVDQLEARGLLVQLKNVAVDAEQLILRAFQCDSRWCLRCAGEGAKKKYKGACCTDLEVDLTPDELERIRKLGVLARERLTLSPRDPLADVVKRMESGKFTSTTDKGERALEHLRTGRCPLSWMERDGTLRCGINSLCLKMELPLENYKPDPCILFPLHYVQYRPGQFLLTVICDENYQYIGADAYVAKLRCLRKPQPDAPPAFVWLKQEIIHCFGEDLYAALEQAAEPILKNLGLDELQISDCGLQIEDRELRES